MTRREALLRVLAIIETATAVGIILFWIGFFAFGLAPSDPPLAYYAFEYAFPAPDSMLAVVLLTAAFCLRDHDEKRQDLGRVLSFAAGGALIFLGVLDASFDIQNGMYTLSAFDGVLAGVLNVWCVGAGFLMIVICRALG